MFTNQLHYGDNLVRLRGEGVDKPIPDEVADLIYLDPPFNSARNYNLLFKQHKGQDSPAQIMTFEDTWTYSPLLMTQFKSDPRNAELFELIDSLHRILGPSEMMAYLLMMAPRLLELHRKLKKTGSLYLHCDPVASHYLKIILDVIFRPENFRNEITWKRTTAHSNIYRNYGKISDTILFYSKGENFKWNQVYKGVTEQSLKEAFPNVDPDGRRWRSENMRNPGVRPNLTYDYTASNGVTYKPHPNGWTISLEKMQERDKAGTLHFPSSPDGRLRSKLYADEHPGVKLQNIWEDIGAIVLKLVNVAATPPKSHSPS